MYIMKSATKAIKTFSLEKEVLREIERTKGSISASERVNRLIKAGLEAERRMALDREAAAFFDSSFGVKEDRTDRNAFQNASIKSLARE